MEHLDHDLDDTLEDTDELAALVTQLGDRDIDPLVATLLETLVEMNSQLQDRIEELEAD